MRKKFLISYGKEINFINFTSTYLLWVKFTFDLRQILKKQIPDQVLALFPAKVKLETENILLKKIAASVPLAY